MSAKTRRAHAHRDWAGVSTQAPRFRGDAIRGLLRSGVSVNLRSVRYDMTRGVTVSRSASLRGPSLAWTYSTPVEL